MLVTKKTHRSATKKSPDSDIMNDRPLCAVCSDGFQEFDFSLHHSTPQNVSMADKWLQDCVSRAHSWEKNVRSTRMPICRSNGMRNDISKRLFCILTASYSSPRNDRLDNRAEFCFCSLIAAQKTQQNALKMRKMTSEASNNNNINKKRHEDCINTSIRQLMPVDVWLWLRKSLNWVISILPNWKTGPQTIAVLYHHERKTIRYS
jgi:hypothetical protein